MSKSAATRVNRVGLITIVAVVIAIATLLLTAVSPVSAMPSAESGVRATAVRTAAIPATTLYVNRTQSGGTYVHEYVTLNNSSSLTPLPYALTAANGCRWVTVLNLTEAANPASVFHVVTYDNVTTANASGTVITNAAHDSFRACTGSAYWVNYIYWSYSIYRFSAPTLNVSSEMTLGGFSDWTGRTSGPSNVSAPIGGGNVAQFLVSTNLTFTAVLPTSADGPQTCSFDGQTCTHTQFSFSSASYSTNVTQSSVIHFTSSSRLLVVDSYANWTVGYSVASVTTATEIGGFFSATSSVIQQVFVNFWYAWVLVLLVLIVLALADRGRRRRP